MPSLVASERVDLKTMSRKYKAAIVLADFLVKELGGSRKPVKH